MVEKITIENLPAREKWQINKAKEQIGIILSFLDVMKENDQSVDDAILQLGKAYYGLGGKIEERKSGKSLTSQIGKFFPNLVKK